MSHDNLANYYTTNFNLKQYFDWSLEEIDEMYPFERVIYINMVNQYIEEKKKANNSTNL